MTDTPNDSAPTPAPVDAAPPASVPDAPAAAETVPTDTPAPVKVLSPAVNQLALDLSKLIEDLSTDATKAWENGNQAANAVALDKIELVKAFLARVVEL